MRIYRIKLCFELITKEINILFKYILLRYYELTRPLTMSLLHSNLILTKIIIHSCFCKGLNSYRPYPSNLSIYSWNLNSVGRWDTVNNVIPSFLAVLYRIAYTSIATALVH